MSSAKLTAAGAVSLFGDILSLLGKAIAGGQQDSVKKVLGGELHTTLIKTRADLEAIVRFRA